MGRHGRIRVTDALKASSKDFVFSKNFEGFEVIAPNETIATQRGETISFPTEKVIVIPRPDALSELDKKSEVIVGYLGEFIR